MEFDLYATAPVSKPKLPSIGGLQWFVFNDGTIVARPTNVMLDIWRKHADVLRPIGMERINKSTTGGLDFRFTFTRNVATPAQIDAAVAIASAKVPKKKRSSR